MPCCPGMARARNVSRNWSPPPRACCWVPCCARGPRSPIGTAAAECPEGEAERTRTQDGGHAEANAAVPAQRRPRGKADAGVVQDAINRLGATAETHETPTDADKISQRAPSTPARGNAYQVGYAESDSSRLIGVRKFSLATLCKAQGGRNTENARSGRDRIDCRFDLDDYMTSSLYHRRFPCCRLSALRCCLSSCCC